ncbi:MAG: FG-GAP repeat protein [Deltaproteobacteria bacterium]|nr:FG-GAP repeat protein [Deltaproteobacteria bacterium]
MQPLLPLRSLVARTAPSAPLGLLALVLLGGCQTELRSAPVIDRDGDQWVAGVDCDDNDALSYPFAEETCDGKDNDCDGEADEDSATGTAFFYADADADGFGSPNYTVQACTAPAGYVDNTDDCDDLDAMIRPGAIEICDEIDNDCDAEIDEAGASDPEVWYEDDDNDGYGNPTSFVTGCLPPEGYVGDNTDCDDDKRYINPGAPELCDDNDEDEDCDGTTDDEDDDVTGLITWYPDVDRDNYGVTGASVQGCEQPPAYARSSDDCDDTQRTVNPGARELCGDLIDNDCDGLLDGADDAAPIPWYADVDGDTWGDPAAFVATVCDNPGGASTEPLDCDDTNPDIYPGAVDAWYDGIDSDCGGEDDLDADFDGFAGLDGGGLDCDDADPRINPGASEICGDGADNDCDGIIDACDVVAVIIGANLGDTFGASVASAGDLNGDLIDDLVVGADHEDSTAAGAGAAFVFYGPVAGELSSDDADAMVYGELIGDHLGGVVAGPGDVTGDGYDDLVVSAFDADRVVSGGGTVYVFAGPLDGEIDLSDAVGTFDGEAINDQAGWALAGGGDVNGDEIVDLITSSYQNDENGAQAGAVYLFLAPTTGVFRMWSADARILGEQAGDQAGYAVAGGADVNGDGLDDLLIGAPNEHSSGVYTGAAYLIHGLPRGTFGLDDADARLKGVNSGDLTGFAAALGDLDGDGYGDMLIGAPEADLGGNTSGAAYVVYGPLGGNRNLGAADVILVGEDNDDYAGSALQIVPDMDEDGLPDVAIGARRGDDGGSNAGAAYLLFGALAGTIDLRAADAKVIGDDAEAWTGAALGGGDVTGDTIGDLLIGAPYQDANGNKDAGQVTIVGGGGWR